MADSDDKTPEIAEDDGDLCFSCHEADNLVTPCDCEKGPFQYVHEKCMITWLKTNNNAYCIACKSEYAKFRLKHNLPKWGPGIADTMELMAAFLEDQMRRRPARRQQFLTYQQRMEEERKGNQKAILFIFVPLMLIAFVGMVLLPVGLVMFKE